MVQVGQGRGPAGWAVEPDVLRSQPRSINQPAPLVASGGATMATEGGIQRREPARGGTSHKSTEGLKNRARAGGHHRRGLVEFLAWLPVEINPAGRTLIQHEPLHHWAVCRPYRT